MQPAGKMAELSAINLREFQCLTSDLKQLGPLAEMDVVMSGIHQRQKQVLVVAFVTRSLDPVKQHGLDSLQTLPQCSPKLIRA
jgi:hypothetical protein